jgi:predicted dehydrogenase
VRLLLFDTWTEAPDPPDFPGLLTVRIDGAVMPGGQRDVRLDPSPMVMAVEMARRGRRLVKRAIRYAGSIGAGRTLSKVRSNLLAYQVRRGDTLCAFAGTVDSSSDARYPIGLRVAGWRATHPLWADRLLAHPDALAPVPPGVSPASAAQAYYLALAAEAVRRIPRTAGSVLVLGEGLTAIRLAELLRADGREVERLEGTGRRGVGAARDGLVAGRSIAVCHRSWLEAMPDLATGQGTVMVGLPDRSLPPEGWQAAADRWIGLPHPDLRRTNIFGSQPLELPGFLGSAGLASALEPLRSGGGAAGEALPEVTPGSAGRILLDRPALIVSTPLPPPVARQVRRREASPEGGEKLRVGFVGLGMWARGNLIPFLLKDPRVRLAMAADFDPVRLLQGASLFDIPRIAADPSEVCRSPEVDAVFISTWHDSHATLADEALRAGKKVFVEKPLAVNREQLRTLGETLGRCHDPFLAVGFNRIHSSLTPILKQAISDAGGRVTFSALVREPTIPATHYYYWPRMGTRIAGNSCHWIDFAYHLLLPREPDDIRVLAAAGDDAQDNNVIVMRYPDGSLVSLTFANRGEGLINGDEQLELKVEGAAYKVHDFKSCTRYAEGRLREIWRSPADRGWERELSAVVDGMLSGLPPRPIDECLRSASLVLDAVGSFLGGDRLGERRGG